MILTSPHRNFINLILVFAFSFGYAENPLLSNYLAKDSKAFPSEIDRQDVTQSPYKELHQMLNKINIGAKDTRFNGTILVGYKGKVIYENAFGNSDRDRKSTRLNSSHVKISYAVFCLKKKKKI